MLVEISCEPLYVRLPNLQNKKLSYKKLRAVKLFCKKVNFKFLKLLLQHVIFSFVYFRIRPLVNSFNFLEQQLLKISEIKTIVCHIVCVVIFVYKKMFNNIFCFCYELNNKSSFVYIYFQIERKTFAHANLPSRGGPSHRILNHRHHIIRTLSNCNSIDHWSLQLFSQYY